MPYLTTNDGADIYYEERGSRGTGPTLVFIPGLTMSIPWWSHQLDGLSDEFYCVSYDPRSQGRSSKVEYGHRTARWGRDLYDVLTELDIDDAVAVGWSLGGYVLLAYADLFGAERLAGMVLVDSGAPETNRRGWEGGMGTESENGEFALAMLDDMPAATETIMGMMFHQPVTAEQHAEMIAQSLQMPPTAAYEIMRDALYTDYRDLMPRIGVPTILALGAHGLTGEHASKYMAEHIAGVEVVVFEHSGHSPFIEEAAKFNDMMRTFAGQLS